MSEVIERMIARTESDIRRAVPFNVGMRNWNALVRETLKEMSKAIAHVEAIERRIKKHRG